ncbi:hypothetical protein F9C11_13100 [Amycolatopsis sp. VS8301801F10]|uniref:hypothetical protein n=1 Tax=Amycolatopsis sp. VS8301801F10 TaxID=2652442 RepID=UPI0038FCF7CE
MLALGVLEAAILLVGGLGRSTPGSLLPLFVCALCIVTRPVVGRRQRVRSLSRSDKCDFPETRPDPNLAAARLAVDSAIRSPIRFSSTAVEGADYKSVSRAATRAASFTLSAA